MKAMIATGQAPSLEVSPNGRELYVADTYLDGPRHLRKDVVSIYDTEDFSLSHVIELPDRRRALMAPRNRTALIDDGRFLLLFNFSPATSVSVVDIHRRELLGTVQTPGCSLLYPTGERGVSMICGDGSLLTLHFDANGELASRMLSEPFFASDNDPIMENGVPIGGHWFFVSYGGDVYPVDLSAETPAFSKPWPLVDHSKKSASWIAALLTGGKAGPWLPGGQQLAAVHEERRELFVLMHPVAWSGGTGDHVFPGPEVWVYDVDLSKRIRRLELRGVGNSIFVTPGENPVLLVSGADPKTEEPRLEVYDATSGEFLREVDEFGGFAIYFYGLPDR
jgi:methylamine dehydrogenase heavy chain